MMTNCSLRLGATFCTLLLLIGCSGSNSTSMAESSSSSASSAPGSDSAAIERIRLNQVGYLPASAKLAVVPAEAGAAVFNVVDAGGQSVLAGTLGSAAYWVPANESVRLADFSALQAPGEYRLRVDGLGESWPFQIAPDLYRPLNDADLKAFYFNRASTELQAEHAGPWARPAGHPDTQVQVHPSAATEERPAGTTRR
jgi:endoglucanase